MYPLPRLVVAVMALLVCLFIPFTNYAQQCEDLKNVTFYSYPKNSADRYKTERNGDIQKETNLKTGEFTTWKIKWPNDCIYSLKYESGKMTEAEHKIVDKYKVITRITSVAPEYYTYECHLENLRNPIIVTDTAWLVEKKQVSDNTLFIAVNPDTIKSKALKNNSGYALLYVYRKGKFFCSKADYLVYFDTNLMYAATNRSQYVFKIFKEGKFKLSARISDKKTKDLELDIKFGSKYYVESSSKFFGSCSLESCCEPILTIKEESKALSDME